MKKIHKNEMGNIYEFCGYYTNYFIGGSYIGTVHTTEPDREVFSYEGRQYHTAEQDLVFGKKVIKKGTTYHTEAGMLLGKLLNKVI